MPSFVENFRRNLQRLLKDPGAKTELAKRMGISPGSLTRYLNGESTPQLDALENFCQALGMSPSELLTDASPPSNDELAQSFARAWNEMKKRSKNDPDYELFEMVENVLKYFHRKRKR